MKRQLTFDIDVDKDERFCGECPFFAVTRDESRVFCVLFGHLTAPPFDTGLSHKVLRHNECIKKDTGYNPDLTLTENIDAVMAASFPNDAAKVMQAGREIRITPPEKMTGNAIIGRKDHPQDIRIFYAGKDSGLIGTALNMDCIRRDSKVNLADFMAAGRIDFTDRHPHFANMKSFCAYLIKPDARFEVHLSDEKGPVSNLIDCQADIRRVCSLEPGKFYLYFAYRREEFALRIDEGAEKEKEVKQQFDLIAPSISDISIWLNGEELYIGITRLKFDPGMGRGNGSMHYDGTTTAARRFTSYICSTRGAFDIYVNDRETHRPIEIFRGCNPKHEPFAVEAGIMELEFSYQEIAYPE